jgi:hypothetical protein
MSKENILRVKSILGPNIIIAGMENYESDKVYYVLSEKLFNYILHGNIYINDTYLYNIITIRQVWNFISKNINIILSKLRKDPYIRDDPNFAQYIDKIEHAIITGLFLQELENMLFIKQPIRKIILNNEPLAYVSLHKYLKNYSQGSIRMPMIENKEKEKEDIETILRMYKVVSKYNLNKPSGLRNLYHELIMAIRDNNYINVKNEMEMIKKYMVINRKAKLKRKIKQLREDIERIDKQINYLKIVDPSNPKIQELEKEKKEIEELLNKLTKRKKIIKENIQNEQEKAKEKSKEIENKNGQ